MRYLIVIVALVLSACDSEQPSLASSTPTPEALKLQSELFGKRVETVTEGVYVAIGFGLVNSIMLEGDEGVVIVDKMETNAEATEVSAAFRNITEKPIKAIIHTHNHADHVFGAGAFADGQDVPVYAHESTSFYINRVINQIRPITSTRSVSMFGSHLSAEERINNGIGPRRGVKKDSDLFALTPTPTFRDSLSASVAGIRLELVHAPGETNDQLFVWLPDKQVVLTGDNIYQAFPNLYTIRGTAYRDVRQWALKPNDDLMILEPASKSVTRLRVKALRALGSKEANPNARNYFFTVAREVEAGLEPRFIPPPNRDFLASLPIEKPTEN